MRTGVVLILSLALTTALLGMNVALYLERRGAPRPQLPRVVTKTITQTVKRAPRQPAAEFAPLATATGNKFHWRALESAEYATYAANLRAIGCPERVVRDILLADVEKYFEAGLREVQDRSRDAFWITGDQAVARERQRNFKERALELEKRELLRGLLGADFSHGAIQELRDDSATGAIAELLLGYLGLEKMDRAYSLYAQRKQDLEALDAETEGIVLDEDVPRFRQLRDQLPAGLAQAMTPLELEELQLRLISLDLADELNRESGVAVNGGEVREVCRAVSRVFDVWSGILGVDQQLGGDDVPLQDEKIAAEIRKAIGPERFADYERGKDHLFRGMRDSLENVPVTKAALVRAHEVNKFGSDQAAQILRDPLLDDEDRALLLAALQVQTTQLMRQNLGALAFDTYLRQQGADYTNRFQLPAAKEGRR